MLKRMGHLLALTALAAALVLPTAMAAAATESDTALTEVVIVAQKREQKLQDIGIAVTAVNNQLLDVAGKGDVKALVNVVPSLQVVQYSPAQTNFNIRGVSQNDFNDTQEGPVAFYNDEVYISTGGAIAGQTFDLDHVEVLRGPQGTLFGRNATGGLVHAITAKPTGALDGYVTLTGASYGQFDTEAAISGPLSGRVRGRLAFTSDRSDGYVRNLYPGSQKGGKTNSVGARGQLEFDVGSHGLLRTKVEYLRNNDNANISTTDIATQNSDGLGVILPRDQNFYGSCPGCSPAGFITVNNVPTGFIPSTDPFTMNANGPSKFDRTYWSGTVNYEQDLGAVKLTSISNYQFLDKSYAEDADGTPYPAIEIYAKHSLHQYSQELRLSGDTPRVHWVTGLYGLQLKSIAPSGAIADAVFNEFLAGAPLGAFSLVSDLVNRQTTKTYAAFAQGEFKLSDTVSLIAGARETSDHKDYSFTHATFGFIDYDFAARRPDLTSKKFSNWSGKLELDAKPNPNTLVYISANRGIKGGGFNAPVLVPSIFLIAVDPFNPTPEELAILEAALQGVDAKIIFGEEVLTSYEGGLKLKLAGGKATLNSTLFHYDYKGYQAFQLDNGSSFIVNLPAKVSGLEVELAARPVPKLNLNLFVSDLFEAKITRVQLPGDGFTPGRFVETRMPLSPSLSIGGAVSYVMPVGGSGALTLATDWKYNSEQYFSAYNAPVERDAAHVAGDVRISYAPNSGAWEAAVFVNNVTDKRYKFYVSDNSFTTTTESVYARPRWVGATFTYRYGQHAR